MFTLQKSRFAFFFIYTSSSSSSFFKHWWSACCYNFILKCCCVALFSLFSRIIKFPFNRIISGNAIFEVAPTENRRSEKKNKFQPFIISKCNNVNTRERNLYIYIHSQSQYDSQEICEILNGRKTLTLKWNWINFLFLNVFAYILFVQT